MKSKKHLIFLSGNFLSLQETSHDDVLEFTLTYTTPVGDRTVKYINSKYNGDIIEHLNPAKSEFNNVEFIKNNYSAIYNESNNGYGVIKDISELKTDLLEYMKDNKTAYSVLGTIQFVTDVSAYCWVKFVKTIFNNYPFDLLTHNISYIPLDISTLFEFYYQDANINRLDLYNELKSKEDKNFEKIKIEDTMDGFIKNKIMSYFYNKMMLLGGSTHEKGNL